MYCPHCGKQLPDGARFCTACGAALGEPAPAPDPFYAPDPAYGAPSLPVRQERVLLGVIGMLPGVILAFVTAFAGETMGIWIGIQGLCMGLAVFSGYRMLGRRLGVAGTVICAVVTAAVVLLAEALIWSEYVAKAYLAVFGREDYSVTFKDAVDRFSHYLSQGLSGSFCLYAALGVLFALAGGAVLAVPDLRAVHLRPDWQPKIPAWLIFLVIVLLAGACFVIVSAGGNTDVPVRSHVYQTVADFIEESLPPIARDFMG